MSRRAGYHGATDARHVHRGTPKKHGSLHAERHCTWLPGEMQPSGRPHRSLLIGALLRSLPAAQTAHNN
eukprot:8316371-Pyramimonas_sp.AAC.1